jgi:hypothetical protein
VEAVSRLSERRSRPYREEVEQLIKLAVQRITMLQDEASRTKARAVSSSDSVFAENSGTNRTVTAIARKKLFISYSHKDGRWLDRVREQLDVLEREGLIDSFDDRRIEVGEDWYARLHQEMLEARVALFLISAPFLTSAFIRNEEIPRLLKQHEARGMVLYPLLIRDCPWQEVSWIARLQLRPKEARPIAAMRSAMLDKCLADVAREIASIVKAGRT